MPSSSSPLMTITVRFRVPYPTLWGQSLAIVGSGPELGDWDPAKGVRMACRASGAASSSPRALSASHGENAVETSTTSTGAASANGGNPLQQPQPQQQQQSSSPPPTPVWEACVELPKGSSVVSYKYLLLSEDGSVARKEPTARAVILLPPPEAAPPLKSDDGGGVSSSSSSSPSPPAAVSALLYDSWLDDAEPGALLGRSAFTDAISPGSNREGEGDGGDGDGEGEGGGTGGGGGIKNPSQLSSSAPSLLDAAAVAAAAAGEGGADSAVPSAPSSQSLHHHHHHQNTNHFQNLLSSSAAAAAAAREPGWVLLRLSVRAWDLRPGESLAVLGSAPSLGSWQTSRAVRMTRRRKARRTGGRRKGDGDDSDGGGGEPPSSSSPSSAPPSPPPPPQRPVPPLWELEVSLPAAQFPVTYRFAVAGGGGGRGSTNSMSNNSSNDPFGGPPLRLEAGENRIVDLGSHGGTTHPPSLSLVAADGGWLRPPDWRRWRGAGLAVPLFSVRSSESLGVGGFADIAPLARWCSSAGLRVLQLLPLNDTRVMGDWRDSYPYATLSAFALHPLYCDVERGLLPEAVTGTADGGGGGESGGGGRGAAPPLPPRALAAVKRLREELEPLDAVDYERVLEAKLEAARAVFDASGRAEVGLPPLPSLSLSSSSSSSSSSAPPPPPAPSPSPSFAAFYEENTHWLRPHAAHRILATKVFGHPEHWRWGSLSSREGGGAAAAASERDLARVLSLGRESEAGSGSASSLPSSSPGRGLASASEDARFEWWLQWKLHEQLLRASHAASREFGVALKGDLPIGVDACGVDAWHRPELFRLGKGSTGAPPDAFDARGQAWGFPTYDWGAAALEGFGWWRSRLARMSKFFHALRVDHVLGFFRIWELEPGAVTGACGRFRPARPVSRKELLEGAGMWDIDRLTHPHITRELAARALASAAASSASAASSSSSSPSAPSSAPEAAASNKEIDALIDRFLEPVPGVPGRLRLRREFDSEAAIDALGRESGENGGGNVKDSEPSSSSSSSAEALRQGLLSLRQNVCLIEDPDLFDDDGGEGEEGSSPPPSSEQQATAATANLSSSSFSSPSPAPPPRSPNARPLLHPRFNLTSTLSFRELGPQGWRDALARLHDDYYYGTFFSSFSGRGPTKNL